MTKKELAIISEAINYYIDLLDCAGAKRPKKLMNIWFKIDQMMLEKK